MKGIKVFFKCMDGFVFPVENLPDVTKRTTSHFLEDGVAEENVLLYLLAHTFYLFIYL